MMNWTALFPSTPTTGVFPSWDHQAVNQSKQEKKEDRRKRNREHAKKTRQRKKSQFEDLTDQVRLLQKENEQLRMLVRKEIPDDAQSIIKECCIRHPLVADGRKKDLAGSDFALIENLTIGRQSFVLTDPHLPDNPIVYASEAFYQLTGFTREETLGRNCRFLQGPETEHKAVEKIRTSIQQGIDASVALLNYKKDGTPFENRFFLAALRDKDNCIVNYVGVQCDIEKDQEHKDIDKTISKPASQLSLDPLTLYDDNHEAERSPKRPRTLQVMGETQYPHGTTTAQAPLLPLVVPPAHAAATSMMNDVDDQDFDRIDWSILAQALEADYKEGSLLDQDGDYPFVYQSPVLSPDQSPVFSSAGAPTHAWDDELSVLSAAQASVWDEEALAETSPSQPHEQQAETYLEHFRSCPGLFVTKTCRSELVASLLSSHGDVTDNRFIKALDVLSSIYSSSGRGNLPYISSPLGSWRSISRPSYGGCLGRNPQGDFCYPLGKMSFNMFKPGNLTCSVQHTLNNITLACEMDGAPKAAPWSLRRELASWDPNNPGKQEIPPCATMLASYE
jgi:PAS domain S-box-containing protein